MARRADEGRQAKACPTNEEGLSDDAVDYFSVDVGQPEIPARIAIGQPFVIEAEEIQDGGV